MRDGGSIYNISFENIKIETKRFSSREWWGKAEGVHISNLERYSNVKLGNIYNLNFNNIEIRGESGIFIYGDNIYNIQFNEIKIFLENKTDYEKNLYDLRPYDKEYIIRDKLGVIYAYKAKNIIIKFLSIEYG